MPWLKFLKTGPVAHPEGPHRNILDVVKDDVIWFPEHMVKALVDAKRAALCEEHPDMKKLQKDAEEKAASAKTTADKAKASQEALGKANDAKMAAQQKAADVKADEEADVKDKKKAEADAAAADKEAADASAAAVEDKKAADVAAAEADKAKALVDNATGK